MPSLSSLGSIVETKTPGGLAVAFRERTTLGAAGARSLPSSSVKRTYRGHCENDAIDPELSFDAVRQRSHDAASSMLHYFGLGLLWPPITPTS